MKQIIITIDKYGNPILQTMGFAGEECVRASRPFEKILGKPFDDRYTAEYWAEQETETFIEEENQ